ncbi:nucleotidyl transferase AbiEii/AbiGii toxin family protein [Paraburkholderia aspalathi]|uniref:Nucleotidyl transferase AbiEii toxin, Type IV TA system n=1 Tax=Paraburkholderia aspalathi TaxID=1324617 RepID=A0A1I7B6Q6_9BURK|nr:nucleotidyl transferase AbiEii/AbiGii toxin family protein [Paraburkholderia aspalathi]SFT82903.1 Nucleotidyl transferase AbiEii toxin, Type IV TA system [Paraburkholderia aspalathi]
MKTIAQDQKNLIDSLVAEGITALPDVILEKDVHVTDVLHAISRIEHKGIELVFCGGTSLSKAHDLIERMSEDIDLKVVVRDGHGLSGTGLKNHLSALKGAVIAELKSMGFEFIEAESKARNSNRYFASGWLYQSMYQGHSSLRPHLSLEFTVRAPRFATTKMPISYLIDQLAQREGETVDMSCIAVEETLAEKVLSFLRRHAEHRAGVRTDWDEALVRHVYDTYCIVRSGPSIVGRAAEHFPELVAFDVEEFPNHAEFAADPKKCMAQALTVAETEAQTRSEYDVRLQPLIYGSIRPNFDEAFAVFKATAEKLLATL